MNSQRGFIYPLAPLCKLSAWELERRRLELAEEVANETDKRQTMATSQRRLSDAVALLGVQAGLDAPIDPAARAMWLGYLHRLDQHCQQAAQQVEDAAAVRQQAADRYKARHQQHQGLESHRENALLEYKRIQGAAVFASVDESWLQTSHWKRNQDAGN
ncbi:hypothetical protein [Chitinimonas sp. BJB300]|uniref:hypothetical protein n=1 Tax=Chitinimonas sp. BJB300 TaxID=1559339 RepID=UPI000C0DED3B|nr:hypothetical protein [Chitinimonas sp. BJB300]PHV12871.1 hypothetical protein CSQ89_03510 [Chitinimonas sp. BJB300]TSJ86097.1 hypothetical protein FG002_016330 [Chitinimonas sp. BJB300]